MLRFLKKMDSKREINYFFFLIHRLLFNRIFRILIGFVLAVVIAPLILFFFLHPHVQKDINYGVTFSSKYATEMGLDWKDTYIKILDDLGVKNIRLVAYWDEVESTRDHYDFSNIKWQLDEAEKRNINVILTVGRKVPRWPECFEPAWWSELNNEELQNIELYQYVEKAMVELKPHDVIKTWQIENEPFWPFGICTDIKKDTVENEIKIARGIDDRPILVQDSGEGGLWKETYDLGDYLGISMYRKIWYDFWGIFLGKFIYFQYPLAHWTYKIKADLVGVPYQNVIVTELQAEPWGPGLNSDLTQEQKDETMSRHDFIATMDYAQRAGFKDLYLWGAEWWLWEKEKNNNPFFWNSAKALFN